MSTISFHYTSGTKLTYIDCERVTTNFFNLKNKADGARRYGYANRVTRFDNPNGDVAFRGELQTTLNGRFYQSSKYSAFFATEAEARAALDKSVAGAQKRYAKLALDPKNKIEQRQ